MSGMALVGRLRRPARFAIVGVANTAVDFAVFGFLHLALGVGIIPSNVVSFSCGIANSYFFNRRWTFSESAGDGRASKQLPLFVAVNIVALGLSTLSVWLLSAVMPALVAKLGAVAITFAWTYLVSARLVFSAARVPDGQ